MEKHVNTVTLLSFIPFVIPSRYILIRLEKTNGRCNFSYLSNTFVNISFSIYLVYYNDVFISL